MRPLRPLLCAMLPLMRLLPMLLCATLRLMRPLPTLPGATLPLMRLLPMLLGATLLAACDIDFAEPRIPDRRAPASLQINMRIFDHGIFQVDGSLSPGRDSLGFQRPVTSPIVQASDQFVLPLALTPQGVRTYSAQFAVPPGATLGPFELTAPAVADVGTLPPLRWFGLRRLDPDTIVLPRGSDIVLNMDTAAAVSDPLNRFRQWFLDVRAGTGVFRISGDGAVPLRIRIPAEWVPSSPDNRATISLIYYQSGQIRSGPGTYVANVTLDTRLQWLVRFTEPDGPAAVAGPLHDP